MPSKATKTGEREVKSFDTAKWENERKKERMDKKYERNQKKKIDNNNKTFSASNSPLFYLIEAKIYFKGVMNRQ